MMGNDKLIAVDLFSGAGGLSIGFLQTGKIKIVAAVENNKWARKTYERNHIYQGTTMYGDINTLNFDKLLESVHSQGYDKVNIVFGGPPCQGFSNANRQKSELISTNNQLVKAYADAIEKLNPDAFLMENVKTLKSDKHKFYYSEFDDEEDIADLGLTPVPEKVTLGNNIPWGYELIDHVNQSRDGAASFMISNKNFLSKISHMLRKEKEFERYLKLDKDPFINYVRYNWDELHNVFWDNPEYTVRWNEIQRQTEEYFNSGTTSLNTLYANLKLIYETQKILQKLDELVRKRIHYKDLKFDGENVVVTLHTYSVLDYLKARFKRLGYKFNSEQLILNASDYGAPQNRERLFILGIKKTFVENVDVCLPEPIIHCESLKYTVHDAISDLEIYPPDTVMQEGNSIKKVNKIPSNPLQKFLNADSEWIHNHVMTDTTDVALKRFEALKEGDNFHKLEESLKTTYTNPNRTQNTVYLRLKYDSQSGTVLNVRKSMWIHPRFDRAISIREAARLQTFPDYFVFEGPKDAQYQQIGNAVPPLLGRAVAEKLLEYLNVKLNSKLKDEIARKAFVNV
jgi:DNA (cytosine-5)-methyltransferase 1